MQRVVQRALAAEAAAVAEAATMAEAERQATVVAEAAAAAEAEAEMQAAAVAEAERQATVVAEAAAAAVAEAEAEMQAAVVAEAERQARATAKGCPRTCADAFRAVGAKLTHPIIHSRTIRHIQTSPYWLSEDAPVSAAEPRGLRRPPDGDQLALLRRSQARVYPTRLCLVPPTAFGQWEGWFSTDGFF
jgi:hypothetical protein